MSDTEKPKPKRSRRGHGAGFCYFRQTDSKWISGVDLGRDAEGKRQRVVYASKTEREALEKLNKALGEFGKGMLQPTDKQTVAEFLDYWLEHSVKVSVRPRTYDDYSSVIENHLKPALGKQRLQKLTVQHVQTMVNLKQREAITPRTVHKIRAVLRAALNDALQWELVPRNVAAKLSMPKQIAYEGNVLTPDEAKALIVALDGNRIEGLIVTTLALGLRQGEALGLRWKDVDLDGKSMRIVQQYQAIGSGKGFVEPKTDRSKRPLPLPDPVIAVLRRQHQMQLEDRVLAGSRWKDHDLVFASTIGTPLNPPNVMKRYHEVLDAAEIKPRRTFHDLRRSCSSLLAAWRVPPRLVADILGHSSITMTLAAYTRSYSADMREALDLMNDLFPSVEDAEKPK